MTQPRKFFFALVAALIAFASSTPAQGCIQDDGFFLPGACCAPVNPTLPNFPAITINSEGCVFKDCNPVAVFPEVISLGAPFQFFCDTFLISAQINGLVNTAPGLMIGKYSRTWGEVNSAGTVGRQVWRFLVNVDFNYLLTAASTGPVPNPAIAFLASNVHFVGSLDYARDCTSGAWSASINLTYLCEAFMHNTFSVNPQPAGTNPNFVYCFAGPTPFLWGAGAPPSGPTIADSVRATRYNLTLAPLQWDCLSEMPTFGGVLTNTAQYCACTLPPNPGVPAWTQQNLQFKYGCNAATSTPYSSLPFGPLIPTGLSAFTLGTYAVPAGVYPGNESVSVYIGVANAADPCANGLPIHLVTGVGTSGGDLAIVNSSTTGGPVTTTEFLDLENMLVLIGGPPFVAIGLGGLFLSAQMFALNF